MKQTEELKELRKKTDVELSRLVSDSIVKLTELHISAKKQELKDNSQIGKLRLQTARIKTILAQRQFMAEIEPQKEKK